jgi:hypothetical protein
MERSAARLPLTRLETGVGLVDDVYATFSANQTVAAVPPFQ